jgi:hypothetical protein
MTTVTVRARGPASKYEIWSRYRDPQRWPEWSRQIAAVRADGPLRPGLEGELETRLNLRIPFEVLAADDQAMRWSWRVRVGPATLDIDHDVSDGYAAARLTGPAVIVLPYAPLARRALKAIVSKEGWTV